MTNYQELEIEAVHPSPFQPRKSFDLTKLNELAASIGPPEPKDGKPAGPGVLSPVVVRTNNKGHELVFGERRWRASKIAGRTTIPAIVVDMSDVEVMEAQLIENSQREDVNALEEAQHYHTLTKKHGHTIESLVAKTGKSRAHIYARIKLLELGAVAKKALADGKLQPAIATDLVVTIGDAKLQEQYVRECLGEDLKYNEVSALEELGIAHEAVSEEDIDGPTFVDHQSDAKPLSYRAARELLRRKYATKLALAKFDPTDEKLTKAGACGPCPHRSGSQPELPGMAPSKTADDVCTKPSCFEEKTQAVWKIQAKDAEARGLKIVEREDTKSVFFESGDIKPTSPYVDPDADLPPDLAKPGSKATWAKLLAKKLSEIPRALVQDVTGAPRELLVKSKAVEVLRELGKIDKPEKPKKSTSSSSSKSSSSSLSAADKEAQAARELERDQEEQALKATLMAIAKAAEDLPAKKDLAFLRLIAKWALQDTYDMELTAERREVQAPQLDKLVDAAKSVGEIRGLVAECMVEATHDTWLKDFKSLFDGACKLLDVDYDAILKDIKADAKERAKAEAKIEAAAAKEAEKKKDLDKAQAKVDVAVKKIKAAAKKAPKKKGAKK